MDVECFGGEEEVEDELDPVCYCEDSVDPLPSVGMICNETHDERARGRAAEFQCLIRNGESAKLTPASP